MKANEGNDERAHERGDTPSKIGDWLEGLGLGQYASAFAANDIDFAVLLDLSDGDLRELGVGSLGHRKRLLAAIAARGAVPARASVEAVATPAGERRQVTILFADLSGFTALSRSLDAEQVHELVARFTSLVDGVIVGYGGSIDKHIGDAVMALFGAPRAHDDDPLRAARAALDIHDALAQRAAGHLARSRRISESPAGKSWPDRWAARTDMAIRSLAIR